ncbi:MAG: WG repeat-containing protein, partial [Muribaculaceae bacterium]|nr:WG repeat-containing protein [Muribaculaceae bacterium]
ILLCISLVGRSAAAQITGWDEVGPTLTGQKYESRNILNESLTAVKKGNKWGFVTPDNKAKIKPKYDAIGDTIHFLDSTTKSPQALNSQAILVQEKGKWGLLDANGKILIKPEYDSLGNFYTISQPYNRKQSEVRCIAQAGNIQYIVNTHGKRLKGITPNINEVAAIKTAIIGISPNGTIKVIDSSGDNVYLQQGDDICSIFFYDSNNNSYNRGGHQTPKETLYYHPATKEILSLTDHQVNQKESPYYVMSTKDGKKGIVTRTGDLATELKYKEVYETDVNYSKPDPCNFVLFKEDGTTDLLKNGKLKEMDVTYKTKYEDFILYSKGSDSPLIGVMKLDGTIISEPKYSSVDQINDGKLYFYCVLLNGDNYAGMLNGKGLIEFPHECNSIKQIEDTHNLILQSADNNGVAILDALEGNMILPFGKYSSVSTMHCGNYFIKSANGKWGVANSDFSKEIIPTKYDDITTIYSSVFPDQVHYKVTLNGKNGACNADGKLVIPIGKYNDIKAYSFVPGFYIVTNGKKQGLVNKNGTQIVPPSYDVIYGYGNNNIMVSNKVGDGEICYIYSKSGKLLKQQKFTNSEANSYRGRRFITDWLGSYPQEF